MQALLPALLLAPIAAAEDAVESTPDRSDASLPKEREYSGTLTLLFENDTFANESDNNFTAYLARSNPLSLIGTGALSQDDGFASLPASWVF